jgi:hypothetical protein
MYTHLSMNFRREIYAKMGICEAIAEPDTQILPT